MNRPLVLTLTLPLAALIACTPVTTPSASGSAPAGASGAAASGSAAPNSSAGASAATNSKYVALQIVAPEPNSKAGVEGSGWTVDVKAKGNGPAIDKVKPAFTQTTSPGMNSAFPGLVVLLKSVTSSGTTSGATAGDPNRNLARMFQVVGLPNTVPTGASTSTSSTSRPAASASAGASSAPSASSGGTATSSTTDNQTATATWFVQQSFWGTDVDVELTVFVVDGDAPDMVSDKSSLKIVSDEMTVRFHINGGTTSPAGSKAPASAAPSSSAGASGSARPSASASSSP